MEASCSGGGLCAGCCWVQDRPSQVHVSPEAGPAGRPPNRTTVRRLPSYAMAAANLGEGPGTDRRHQPALVQVQVSPSPSKAAPLAACARPPKTRRSELRSSSAATARARGPGEEDVG